jgi:hypothetical protein
MIFTDVVIGEIKMMESPVKNRRKPQPAWILTLSPLQQSV